MDTFYLLKVLFFGGFLADEYHKKIITYYPIF